MYPNRSPTPPPAPPRLPCIRDLNELLTQHLPASSIIKLTPLAELSRRLDEIVAEYPHLREEAPLVMAGEERRRRRLQGELHPITPYRFQRHA